MGSGTKTGPKYVEAHNFVRLSVMEGTFELLPSYEAFRLCLAEKEPWRGISKRKCERVAPSYCTDRLGEL